MDNDDCYIAAAGEGYEWLSASGLPLLYDAIAAYPDSPVIFNFGVNDYDNMALYLALYQSLVQDYPDTRFYFLSVNPIEPTLCHNITNEEIADFNQHLKDLFPDTYIDSFTYLMVNQAVTIDGIHYSSEDYRKIYEFATAQIAADPENAD
jgi:lysophospholipase L1-like esterase